MEEHLAAEVADGVGRFRCGSGGAMNWLRSSAEGRTAARRIGAPNHAGWIVTSDAAARSLRRAVLALAALACLVPAAAAGAGLERPEGIAVEADGRLLVVDSGARALVRVDPVTGETTVVSDDATGTGPRLRKPLDVALESSGSAVVVDAGPAAVVRVDAETGKRSIVSNAQTGSGPVLVQPVSVAVEADGQIVVVDRALAALLRVDAVSGDRVVVSDADTGSGRLLERPQGIEVEPTGALLVADRQERDDAASVYRVDPVTGDRAVVTGPTRGEGNGAGLIVDLALLPDGQIAVLDDSGRKQVLAVDPVTGDRERLSGAGVGGGPAFEDPRGVAATTTHLMAADAELDAVVRVDPLDGSRYVLGAAFTGAVTSILPSRVICRNETTGQQVVVRTEETSWDCDALGLTSTPGDVVFTGAWGEVHFPGDGPQLDHPRGVAVEAGGSILLADDVDGLPDALFRIDPKTGDRTILSDPDTGIGPIFDNLWGLAVEADATIFATDVITEAIYRVDPITGDRTIVSDADHGTGQPLDFPVGVALDADGTLVVAEPGVPGLLRVDPVSGDRTIVTGDGVGAGPGLQSPWGVAIEADGSILVADQNRDVIFRVDPLTGDRSFVTEDFVDEDLRIPRGIALEGDGQIVAVGLDRVTLDSAVFRVDPVTGDVGLVSGAEIGSGLEFSEPSWIAIEADGHLLVTDINHLFRVDPVTGDREVLSGPQFEDIGGAIGGVEFPAEVTCRNLTTGQVAREGVDSGTSWSCERSPAFEAEDGDQVFTGARAVR